MTLEEEAIQAVQGQQPTVAAPRLIELHKALIGGIPDKWYCTTCPGKLRAIFLALKLKYYTKPVTQMATSKYTWNPKFKGVKIVDASYPRVVTAESMTDEDGLD